LKELVSKGVVVYRENGHNKIGTLLDVSDGYLKLMLDDGRIEYISTSGTIVKQKEEEQKDLMGD